MDTYLIVLTAFGFVTLLTAWVPMLIRDLPLSLPIFCMGLGAVAALVPGFLEDFPHPLEHRAILERLSEFIVIVALMGAGLKLDRVVGFRSWASTWRLLGISMPLTIAAVALAGWALFDLGLATALLLGAVLAPTDPVLASDVQVGPPRSGSESEIRFSLTSEAGLNDALAFPFVNLAIAIAIAGPDFSVWLADWLLIDVLWKLAAGLAFGCGVGWLMGIISFRLPRRYRLARSSDGLVALGVTLFSYGLTELAGGYGFLAVFVAGVALRNAERDHRYHQDLHEFADETERLWLMIFLVAFGAAVAVGGVFADLTGAVVLFAALALFVIRPAAGWVGLIGRRLPAGEKVAIGFFGIRGIGSFYYLAYALGQAEFQSPELLMAAVSLTVVFSIVIHGITATPVMRRLEARDR